MGKGVTTIISSPVYMTSPPSNKASASIVCMLATNILSSSLQRRDVEYRGGGQGYGEVELGSYGSQREMQIQQQL
jgi:hypothetical protein